MGKQRRRLVELANGTRPTSTQHGLILWLLVKQGEWFSKLDLMRAFIHDSTSVDRRVRELQEQYQMFDERWSTSGGARYKEWRLKI